MMDTSRVERRVSLDLDGDRLISLVESAGGSEIDTILIPIGLLPKGLLLDFDLRDASGSAVSLVTSRVDSQAAQASILALLDELGEDVHSYDASLLNHIYTIAREHPSEHDIGVLRGRVPSNQVCSWTLPGRQKDSAEYATWKGLFKRNAFVELLATFTVNFMPMMRFKLSPGTTLVKYRQVERQEPSSASGLRARFSIDPYRQLIPAPSIGRCSREHFRFDAPEGTFLEEFFFPERASKAPLVSLVSDLRPAGPDEVFSYSSRVTPERGIIYSHDLSSTGASYVATASLRPRVAGFLRLSQFTVFASALLLLAGTLSEFVTQTLSSQSTQQDAAVAILAVVPSVMSAYLAHEGEHELLSELLRAPRWAVAGSAAATIFASGAMVLQLDDPWLRWVWASASAVCFAVLALLVVVARASSIAYAETSLISARTFEDDLP